MCRQIRQETESTYAAEPACSLQCHLVFFGPDLEISELEPTVIGEHPGEVTADSLEHAVKG